MSHIMTLIAVLHNFMSIGLKPRFEPKLESRFMAIVTYNRGIAVSYLIRHRYQDISHSIQLISSVKISYGHPLPLHQTDLQSPADVNSPFRDLAQHIRDQIKVAFSKGELQQSQVNQTQCDRNYQSLRRLASNQYAELYSRGNTATASGLTPQQCNLALTPELQEYFLEEDKSNFQKIIGKLKKDDSKPDKSV